MPALFWLITMFKIISIIVMFFLSGVSMANSLFLPSPESLAGEWVIIDDGKSCHITFSSDKVENINGYKLLVNSPCKHIVLPELPAAWRPAPDGIDLLNHDGMSILFFSQDGESYRSNIWDKQGKILKRNIK